MSPCSLGILVPYLKSNGRVRLFLNSRIKAISAHSGNGHFTSLRNIHLLMQVRDQTVSPQLLIYEDNVDSTLQAREAELCLPCRASGPVITIFSCQGTWVVNSFLDFLSWRESNSHTLTFTTRLNSCLDLTPVLKACQEEPCHHAL